LRSPSGLSGLASVPAGGAEARSGGRPDDRGHYGQNLSPPPAFFRAGARRFRRPAPVGAAISDHAPPAGSDSGEVTQPQKYHQVPHSALAPPLTTLLEYASPRGPHALYHSSSPSLSCTLLCHLQRRSTSGTRHRSSITRSPRKAVMNPPSFGALCKSGSGLSRVPF